MFEHSLVTDRNARAFMELFVRSDTQFQEYIDRALVNNDYQVEPPSGITANTGPTAFPTPDSTVQK